MIDRDHAHDKVDDQDDYESCAPRNSIPFGLKEEREDFNYFSQKRGGGGRKCPIRRFV